LAVQLEKQIGKKKILERYVNSVFFGNGAYGVQAASEVYFDKNVTQLNWAEGALLAALIRSPTNYNPFRFPKIAQHQRDLVFQRLIETHRLTAAQVKVYKLVPLPTVQHSPTPVQDYFIEAVKQQLLDDPSFGLGATPEARKAAVFGGGLRIFTTFDPVAQHSATDARDDTVPGGRHDGTFDVADPRTGQPVIDPKTGQPTFGTQAIVSIEPSTGAVRVMVGGPGFDKYKFNLATAQRQPGSSMKMYVLASLFENGYVPNDLVNGGHCTFNFPGDSMPYSPPTEGGYGTITAATKVSSNCAFMRLGQLIGLPTVASMATQLGITTPLQVTTSTGGTFYPNNLPLGTVGVEPFDQAAAYSVIANDGVRNAPYMVDKIEDRTGRVIYKHTLNPQRVITSQAAREVAQVLQANVQGGTGTAAQQPDGQPAAGKTGTTNDSTNVWFVGFTPQLATAIWMGVVGGNIPLNWATNLGGQSLYGATGGKFPAKTWGVFYQKYLAGKPIEDFLAPGPERPGKPVGKIPYEVGAGGTGSGTTHHRSTGTGNRGGAGGGTTGTTPADPDGGDTTPTTSGGIPLGGAPTGAGGTGQ
ncbi:MAG TPA: penicillin-binding transpeptidase domain-containing protein, partial [Acidimicrobiales bacterium]